jgi:predicted HTH transcriptional regulator
MKQQSNITIKELAENIGISTRAIEKQIKISKEHKKIKRNGSDKLGEWEVVYSYENGLPIFAFTIMCISTY